MAKKSTNAELQKRYIDILQLINQGYKYVEIAKYCEDTYNITGSETVSKYIKKAKELIYEEAEEDIEKIKKDINSKYDELYKRLFYEEKYRDAGYILAQKAKISGLENVNVHHSGTVNLSTEADQKLKEIFESEA